MASESETIKAMIESGELSHSSDRNLWQIGPYTGFNAKDVYRGWKAQTTPKKPTHQERLEYIFSEVATYGEVTKGALRSYCEGRISYPLFMEVVRKGIKAHGKQGKNKP